MEIAVKLIERTRVLRSVIGILLIYGASIALSVGFGLLIAHLALEWIRS